MKFEYKKIFLEDKKSDFLTLVPREDKVPDYACRAISFELRGKYYNFLQKPYKKVSKPYIFFEGESLYIVKNERKDKVYFFDKYSEMDVINFQQIFFMGLSWQSILASFEKVTANLVFKNGYKGTGSFQDLQKKIRSIDSKYMSDYSVNQGELLSDIYEFITFVNTVIIHNKKSDYYILKFEELKSQTKKHYIELMNELVVRLTEYNKNYQVEKWTEWEEALDEWRVQFLKKQNNHGTGADLYINEFQHICQLRNLSEAFSELVSGSEELNSKIKENTINRIFLSVGNRYGVDEGTIIKTFKKLFRVKNKKEVINILEQKIIKGERIC